MTTGKQAITAMMSALRDDTPELRAYFDALHEARLILNEQLMAITLSVLRGKPLNTHYDGVSADSHRRLVRDGTFSVELRHDLAPETSLPDWGDWGKGTRLAAVSILADYYRALGLQHHEINILAVQHADALMSAFLAKQDAFGPWSISGDRISEIVVGVLA